MGNCCDNGKTRSRVRMAPSPTKHRKNRHSSSNIGQQRSSNRILSKQSLKKISMLRESSVKKTPNIKAMSTLGKKSMKCSPSNLMIVDSVKQTVVVNKFSEKVTYVPSGPDVHSPSNTNKEESQIAVKENSSMSDSKKSKRNKVNHSKSKIKRKKVKKGSMVLGRPSEPNQTGSEMYAQDDSTSTLVLSGSKLSKGKGKSNILMTSQGKIKSRVKATTPKPKAKSDSRVIVSTSAIKSTSKVQVVKSKMVALKSKLDAAKSKLDATKSKLDATKSKLDATKSKLDATKSKEFVVRSKSDTVKIKPELDEKSGSGSKVPKPKVITITMKDIEQVKSKSSFFEKSITVESTQESPNIVNKSITDSYVNVKAKAKTKDKAGDKEFSIEQSETINSISLPSSTSTSTVNSESIKHTPKKISTLLPPPTGNHQLVQKPLLTPGQKGVTRTKSLNTMLNDAGKRHNKITDLQMLVSMKKTTDVMFKAQEMKKLPVLLPAANSVQQGGTEKTDQSKSYKLSLLKNYHEKTLSSKPDTEKMKTTITTTVTTTMVKSTDDGEKISSEKGEKTLSEKGEKASSEKGEKTLSEKGEKFSNDKGEKISSEKEEKTSSEKGERPSADKEEKTSSGKGERPSTEKDENATAKKSEKTSSGKSEKTSNEKSSNMEKSVTEPEPIMEKLIKISKVEKSIKSIKKSQMASVVPHSPKQHKSTTVNVTKSKLRSMSWTSLKKQLIEYSKITGHKSNISFKEIKSTRSTKAPEKIIFPPSIKSVATLKKKVNLIPNKVKILEKSTTTEGKSKPLSKTSKNNKKRKATLSKLKNKAKLQHKSNVSDSEKNNSSSSGKQENKSHSNKDSNSEDISDSAKVVKSTTIQKSDSAEK